MRRLMMAAAITALAGAGSLIAGSAQALPGAGGLRSTDNASVEQVQMVCPRPFWNGWRWVQPPCRPAYAPQYYAPRYYAPYAYGGPPVVVVRPWRRYGYY
jgi:hypothetical protein